MKRTYFALLAMVLLISSSSCEFRDQMTISREMQTTVSEKYNTDKVGVRIINDDTVEVIFTDEKLLNLLSEEKSQAMEEVQKIIESLDGAPKYGTIKISFLNSSGGGLVSKTRAEVLEVRSDDKQEEVIQ